MPRCSRRVSGSFLRVGQLVAKSEGVFIFIFGLIFNLSWSKQTQVRFKIDQYRNYTTHEPNLLGL